MLSQDGVEAAIDGFLAQHGGPALREDAVAEYVQVGRALPGSQTLRLACPGAKAQHSSSAGAQAFACTGLQACTGVAGTE